MSSLGLAALLGAAGVGLGAFGAHGLAERLDARALEIYETGVRYQMFHALALLGLAAFERTAGFELGGARWCWTGGVLVFSGTLYALALGAPRWLGAVTPLGGLALIAGWLLLLRAAGR